VGERRRRRRRRRTFPLSLPFQSPASNFSRDANGREATPRAEEEAARWLEEAREILRAYDDARMQLQLPIRDENRAFFCSLLEDYPEAIMRL